MEFEDVFQYIGDIGLYQSLLYVLAGLTLFCNAFQNLGINFIGAYQDHWCHVGRLESFPHDIQRLVAIPYDADDPGEYDTCQMYDLDYDSLSDDAIWNWDRNVTVNATLKECVSWVYDQSIFSSTINSQYDLVCGRSWLSQFASTAYMFGIMIGSAISGAASDRFGRYKILLIGFVGNLAFGLAEAFAPNYPSFFVFRFLVAVFDFSAFLCAFVIVMEILGPKYRTLLGAWFQAFFSIGYMLVSGTSYAIRDHRNFMITVAVPVACMFPFIWFTTSLVYYGLALNAGAFGDIFLNNFLGGAIEVVAITLCMFCLDKASKRFSNAICLLVAGVFCIACVPVLLLRDDLNNVLTALSTIGKGGITFSFASINVYSADLFPTPVRQKAVGTSSVFARIGSMAAPFMGPPMEGVWKPMPSLIFGILALFTGCLVFRLPETNGHKLPDTIEEAENIGRLNKKKVSIVEKPELEPDHNSKKWEYGNPAFEEEGSLRTMTKSPRNSATYNNETDKYDASVFTKL